MDIPAFWKPFEVHINSFEQILEKFNEVMEKAEKKDIQFAWRGQVDYRWALHSSLYRRLILTKGQALREQEFSKEEQKILIELHRWGLHSPPGYGRLSVLNQLAMLQHYGAPTRLIDISFNA
ncbi:MAG: FRG domain-containing protein [Armatimonadetes bacterium]|nr:FRG domain-containing protein [Armatimonadota bacterium]